MMITSTSATSSSIQAIKRGDIHRITSGQVILDVQSAVKELVENALDAGATVLEIRFKEYGADAIEVIDNGTGIEEANYTGLALKHHTSKLSSFSDLTSVQTFGFRGEALSSLCELARVQVTTATQEQQPVGRLFEFNRDGTLNVDDVKKAPRQRGTTVIVSDLFHTLPVRRSELIRNVKREFAKAQALLQSYAIISQGVRWIVTNTVKGRKMPVMTIAASNAPNHLKSNVTAVYGPKASAQVVPLDLTITLAAPFSRISYTEDDEENSAADTAAIRVSGLISRPAIGCGRPSSDRTFLYVNGRPWDASKVVRAFNEVYRQFNVQQYPMVIADFAVQGQDYDVNVSPDKRTLFLHKEGEIIERLKSQLEHAFTPYQSHFNVKETETRRAGESVWAEVDVRKFATGKKRREESSASEDEEEEERRSEKIQKQTHQPHESPSNSPVRTLRKTTQHSTQVSVPRTQPTQARLDLKASLQSFTAPGANTSMPSDDALSTTEQDEEERNEQNEEEQNEQNEEEENEQDEEEKNEQDCPVSADRMQEDVESLMDESESEQGEATPVVVNGLSPELSDKSEDVQDDNIYLAEVDISEDVQENQEAAEEQENVEEVEGLQDGVRDLSLSFDLSTIRQVLESHRKSVEREPEPESGKGLEEAAVEQTDAGVAEAALSRFIEKDDFSMMNVLGQFNLGFIIVRRKRYQHDDLFIVDQHAADEKYNFETLNRTTKLQSQRLIVPRKIQLSPAEELIAAEHIDNLAAHGFEIRLDADAPPGERITLVALPMSQRLAFGVEDLEELLNKLSEERPDGERARGIRCSKLRAMLASRACRKSIMIGTALPHRQMQSVIRNLGGLDSPWNCPHGRPTMRHLFDLTRIPNRHANRINWSNF